MKIPLCPRPFLADDRKLLLGDGGGAGVLGLVTMPVDMGQPFLMSLIEMLPGAVSMEVSGSSTEWSGSSMASAGQLGQRTLVACHVLHEDFLGGLGPRDLTGDVARGQGVDAVADAQQLREFG